VEEEEKTRLGGVITVLPDTQNGISVREECSERRITSERTRKQEARKCRDVLFVRAMASDDVNY